MVTTTKDFTPSTMTLKQRLVRDIILTRLNELYHAKVLNLERPKFILDNVATRHTMRCKTAIHIRNMDRMIALQQEATTHPDASSLSQKALTLTDSTIIQVRRQKLPKYDGNPKEWQQWPANCDIAIHKNAVMTTETHLPDGLPHRGGT